MPKSQVPIEEKIRDLHGLRNLPAGYYTARTAAETYRARTPALRLAASRIQKKINHIEADRYEKRQGKMTRHWSAQTFRKLLPPDDDPIWSIPHPDLPALEYPSLLARYETRYPERIEQWRLDLISPLRRWAIRLGKTYRSFQRAINVSAVLFLLFLLSALPTENHSRMATDLPSISIHALEWDALPWPEDLAPQGEMTIAPPPLSITMGMPVLEKTSLFDFDTGIP